MMNTATAQTNNFWEIDFTAPQPIQDAELLRQLNFIPGLKEILMLRQVHALEHATVWVLSNWSGTDSHTLPKPTVDNRLPWHSWGQASRNGLASLRLTSGDVKNTRYSTNPRQVDNDKLGGLSTDQGFYLYGDVNLADLRRAVPIAQERLTRGEWDLAVHPRCGTNISVGMVLTIGLVMGTHIILPRSPIEQIFGISLAAAMATQLAPDLGILVQRYLTTAIPFNLAIADITQTPDLWGRPSHFVQVQWQD